MAPTALVDAGRFACTLVGDLDTIRRHWQRDTADTSGSTGLVESDHAIAETVHRWNAELGLYVDTLRTLCNALPTAAAGYRSADASTAIALATSAATQAPAAQHEPKTSSTKPDRAEPSSTNPRDTNPDRTEPHDTEPRSAEPDSTKTRTAKPAGTEPDITQPGHAEQRSTEPGAAEPSATNPGGTGPGSAEFGGADFDGVSPTA